MPQKASDVRGLCRGRPINRLGLALVGLLAMTAGACRNGAPGSGTERVPIAAASAAAPAAATAAQIVAAVQAQRGTPVGAAVAQSFKNVAAGLEPQFPGSALAAEAKRASVTLPQVASGAMHLQDQGSGLTLDVALAGALSVAAQTVGGLVVYPAALSTGAALLHRPLPSGNEDFVYMLARPAKPEVDFSVSLGTGVSGLRLVGGVLELLDSTGAPRLHVSPPSIVGSDGTTVDGALAVAGCSLDVDPSPPWGRAVTPPGATSCTVKVTWSDAAVTYPAILDPRWTTAGSMATARFEHTLILLSTGRALAAGGRSTTSGATGLASAELFDPTTGTWSATASMVHGRRLHTATQLGSSSNSTTSGKVLVAGGISGTTSLNSAELYSPSAGTWIAAGTMDAVRNAHTATLLPDGRVLAAGGVNGTTTLPSASLYNPASGAGSWVATTGPIPPAGLKNHTATLIQTANTQLNNHVLLVGGNDGTSTLAVVYLFDPVQNAFSTLASISTPREQHTALTLQNTNGKILVAGGKNGSTPLATAIVFDPGFSNGSWSSAGTMTSARVGATMTLLPSTIVDQGQVLVAGGSSTGSDTLSSAELFSNTSTWTATPSMPGPMKNQVAVLLSGNMVLLAGGLNGSTVLTSAFLYDASFGLSCTSNSQCASGFCTNGVCCDTACNSGTCSACNVAGHLGTCSPRISGTVCRGSTGACDPAETCNGTSLTCPSDSLATAGTICRASTGACDPAETCSGTSASCPSDSLASAGTVCRAPAGACDVAETCSGTAASCPSDGVAAAGTVCRAVAGTCDVAETCSGTSTACPADAFLPSSTVCRASSGQCDVAESCTGSAAACPADGKLANGTTCSDGDACTRTDTCQSGVCTGGNPVTCVAQDQCHTVGTCNSSTGVCSNPAKANGTTCSDGNACTQTDTCQAGTCTGGSPVTCVAQDQCHTAGTCNSSTGVCSNPAKANGTTCSDGNACTQADTCQSGTCTGGNPVTCTAQDQCHGVGACNPSNGTCSNPALANGTACSDGNACTQSDSCQAGTCTGSNPVTCTAQDQCHTAGTCNPSTGACSNPLAANGTACSDGNACTQSDSCQAGTCTGSNPVTCAALDQCHGAGTCNPATGSCSNPALADGTACNDGNACTQTDTCQAGSCAGASPVTCTAQDQCHTAGSCDPATGRCSANAVADGTTCSDGNACTTGDHCQTGACSGTPVTCSAPDLCHSAGTCNASTGACSNPAVADGTPCDDANACTTGEMCTAGACGGGSTSGCTGLVLQTNGTSPSAFESIAISVASDLADLAPGDHPHVNATFTDEGLSFQIDGNLTAENAGNATVTIGATALRVETFSAAQNQWIPIVSWNLTATGQQLPEAPPNTYAFLDDNVFNAGVTYKMLAPPETIIAPGATAGWFYFYDVEFTRADAAQLTQAARTSSVRFVIEVDSVTGGSVALAPVDLTAMLASLPDYPLEVMTVSGTLDSGSPVTLAPTSPIAHGQASAVFTGTLAAPAATPRTSFADDASYLQYLLSTTTPLHIVAVSELVNGTVAEVRQLGIHSAVPVVEFGLVAPAPVEAGQPVHYDLDFRNDGSGRAAPISLTYFLDGVATGTVAGPAQLSAAQTATGTIDVTAPGAGPLEDQIRLTWQDRNGNVYGPLTQTSTSCPIGACATLATYATVSLSARGAVAPDLAVSVATDKQVVTPGDPITVTAHLTNDGTALTFGQPKITLTNTGFAPLVVPGYAISLESFSLTQDAWVPFARLQVDSSGNLVPQDPSIATLDWQPVNYSQPVGQTILPGQTTTWTFFAGTLVLPAAEMATLVDPASTSDIRCTIQFEPSSGSQPPPAVTDLEPSFVAAPRSADGFTVQISAPENRGQPPVVLSSNDTGPLPAGSSRTYAVTTAAFAPGENPPGNDGAEYLQRLQFETDPRFGGLEYDVGVISSSQLLAWAYTQVHLTIPIVAPQLFGPSQGHAGVPLSYRLFLTNAGNEVAFPTSLQDQVDGAFIPTSNVSLPPSLAAGVSANGTFNATVPVTRDAGPMAAAAQIKWQDRNHNSYGPVSSTFTTNILPAQPGYLALSTSMVNTAISGRPQTITATVTDQAGSPMANVSVQIAVSGANVQTAQVTTGVNGTASFSYAGAKLGQDTATATATLGGAMVTAIAKYVWASTTPDSTGLAARCTGSATPLDAVLVIDGSPSMFTDDQIAIAQAAAGALINDLDFTRDQVGGILFSGGADLYARLTTDGTLASTEINQGINDYVHACDGFCAGGTNFPAGLEAALAELQGPRHRPGATPLMIFLSDGGNTGDNPSPDIAAVKAAGIRSIAIGYGSSANVPMMLSIASSSNDFFYAPSIDELSWAIGNVVGDACRTQPPLVTAGPSQSGYDVRLPATLTLQGEVHGAGPQGNLNLTSTWTEVSGPAPVVFVDPTSPTTSVLFSQPGTYVFQLETSDGFLTTASTTTVTVDPDPSIVGANLTIALASPGPLVVGATESITAALVDTSGLPITNFLVQLAVAGANPGTQIATTNQNGIATFAYVGTNVGDDVLQATALGTTLQLGSNTLGVSWKADTSGAVVTQGWIGSPAHQATVTGVVPITLAPSVTLTSGTVSYWPFATPSQVHVITGAAQGGPGATIATFDTTVVANGMYVVDVNGTDDHGNHQDNEIALTVAGDYKPGREIVEVTEFRVPIAGTPITVGRRYDSLEKDSVGDFGNGWSLTIGHPNVRTDPAHNVTITMPSGRRVTFYFRPLSYPFPFRAIFQPMYLPEPGTFGTLSSDGCPLLVQQASKVVCFVEDSLEYAPTTYTYTDPHGTSYVMATDGTLKTISDLNHDSLTFTADGITSPTGQAVAFTRDSSGRITKILTPSLGDFFNTRFEYDYTYDDAGDLTIAQAPTINVFAEITRYGYDGSHRLTSTVDPAGHARQTSTYDGDGRLATAQDAMGNVFRYAYDVPGHATTTTFPDGGKVVEQFDDRGLMLSQTDQLGRVTTREYDANRSETKRINPLGETTLYTYDGNGNRTSSTNALGETTTVAYNELSEPVTITNALGTTTTIAYDHNGVPTAFGDDLGVLANFTSSEHGLPITMTDAAGNTVYVNYDGSGNLTGRTDRLGRLTTYQFDPLGRKTSMTDPRGGVTTYTYDALGDLLTTANPLGFGPLIHMDANRNVQQKSTLNAQVFRNTEFSYDGNNNLTTILHDNDGTAVHQTWDYRRRLLTRKDELGATTAYEYDLAGELVKTTNPDGSVTTRSYDGLGRAVSETDEVGNVTTFEYQAGCDCNARLTAVTNGAGERTRYTYDALGRRTSMIDPAGHQTSYAYDPRGQLIETDYADGTAVRNSYDAVGNRVSSTDQTGATTTFGYDAERELTSVTDPLGHVTRYGYDANGNLVSVKDANGNVTTYDYDAGNRKIRRTLPSGGSETFAYDGDGNNTTRTDFRGKATTYTFDARSPARMIQKLPDPGLGEPTVSYTYLANDSRSTMADAGGTTTYTYDLRNRLHTKSNPAGTLTYGYDLAGNVTTVRSSNPNGTSVDYAWDAAGRLVGVTDNRVGGTATQTYTSTGQIASAQQPNGVSASYVYDPVDRPTSVSWQHAGAPALASWAYTYNGRGQAIGVTEATGRQTVYEFDRAARLTSETVASDPQSSANGAVTYALDAAGNRVSRSSSVPSIGNQQFSYDQNDQITGETYDPNGSTTQTSAHTYTYDFENHLASSNQGAVSVTYDGDGARIAKTAAGVTTRYLVDDLNPTGYRQVVEEVVAGAVQTRYTVGTSLVSQTQQQGGNAPQTKFYGHDARRNVSFLTDPSGAVTDTYHYDAWGNVIGRTGTTANTRLYGGEEFDPDLGVSNLRARYYRPDTGRFMTLDPAAGRPFDPQSFNRYLYAENDPVNRRDPTGMDAEEEGEFTAAIAVPLAVPAVAVAEAPVAIQTSAGLLIQYRVIVTGGALASIGLKTDCSLSVAASDVPLQAKADGICKDELMSCATLHPDEPVCNDAGPGWVYGDADAALSAWRASSGKDLEFGAVEPTKNNPATGRDPWCPTGKGMHYDVKDLQRPDLDKAGAIVCCTCCQDTPAGPFFPVQQCLIANPRSASDYPLPK